MRERRARGPASFSRRSARRDIISNEKLAQTRSIYFLVASSTASNIAMVNDHGPLPISRSVEVLTRLVGLGHEKSLFLQINVVDGIDADMRNILGCVQRRSTGSAP